MLQFVKGPLHELIREMRKSLASTYSTEVAAHENEARGSKVPVLEEEVDDLIAAIVVVEEDVQGPMHEPAALLQLLQDGCKGVGVDDLLQFHQVFCGNIPPLHEDLRGQDSPQGAQALFAAGG